MWLLAITLAIILLTTTTTTYPHQKFTIVSTMRLHFLTPIFTPIFTLLTCSNAAKQIPITPTPVEAPNLLLKSTIDNATIANSMVIPGGSPFFYLDDPKDNIFAVESIAMTPTPCVMYASFPLSSLLFSPAPLLPLFSSPLFPIYPSYSLLFRLAFSAP